MTGRLQAWTVASGEDTDEDFKVLVYEALKYQYMRPEDTIVDFFKSTLESTVPNC